MALTFLTTSTAASTDTVKAFGMAAAGPASIPAADGNRHALATRGAG